MDIQTARQLTQAINLLTKELGSIRKLLDPKNAVLEGTTRTFGGSHKDPISNLEDAM